MIGIADALEKIEAIAIGHRKLDFETIAKLLCDDCFAVQTFKFRVECKNIFVMITRVNDFARR